MVLNVLSIAYPFARTGPDAVGGAEQMLTTLDDALTRAGHRSIVIACAGSQTSGVLIAIPEAQDIEAQRASVHQAVRHATAGVLASTPISLVHCHGIDFADLLPTQGVPVLVTLHLPPSWYPPAALRPTRPRTWLHAVSRSQHASCPPGPWLLPPIANGIPARRLAAARHGRRGYALTLGRICPEKAQHLAIAAARAAGIPLLIGGAAFPYKAHQDYFASHIAPHLGRSVRFLGPLGFARKRRLLAAARCLLVPSLAAETSSLVAMEAAACGTPVIAFANGALPEIVRHGQTGFLVADATAMAAAIPRCDTLDRATIRRIGRGFDATHCSAAYLSRYQVLAAS